MMLRSYRILSALLCYPSADLMAVAAGFAPILDEESLVPAAQRPALDELIDSIANGEIYDLQERYGLLFDRSRTLALHLFEHVHGESRDRGQAMVDLQNLYREGGLEVAAGELPDFIPLFLEYLSTRDRATAKALLAEPAHILAGLAERLGRRSTPYRAVFDVLVAIAQAQPEKSVINDLLEEPDADPMDLVALDAAWEEEEVRFGPSASNGAACDRDTMIARLRHARRDVGRQAGVPSNPNQRGAN
jgi:nitrate reductase delta subunit